MPELEEGDSVKGDFWIRGGHPMGGILKKKVISTTQVFVGKRGRSV